MTDEETRDDIIDIVNNEEPIIEEEIKEEVKPKSKPKSRAKPKQIKITKESVEPVEPVVEEAIVEVEEKPKNR